MNKQIRSLIIEIIFLVLLIITIIPIYINLSNTKKRETTELLSYVEDLNINVTNNQSKTLYPMTDTYAKENLDNNIINISNNTNNNKDYKLIFAKDKNSTLNTNCLKIMIDNNIYYLNDLYYYEDNEYTYYLVYESNIIKKSNQDILFNYFITCEDNSLIQGTNLIYNIFIQE